MHEEHYDHSINGCNHFKTKSTFIGKIMNVSIAGQHITIGTSLSEYVEERIQDVTKKYFDKAVGCNVHFTKENFEYLCDIVLHEGTGRHMTIRSNAKSDDIYSAFDMSLTKLEKQLRKYKSKLKDRHNRVKASETQIKATKYIISPYQGQLDEMPDDTPKIIAEKPSTIMTLSVSEAVMKMDLENLPALMFNNDKTGRINIVYHRRDGNISWVDSD